MSDKEIGCTRCNWIRQGATCCHCGNPDQTDEELKAYVYSGYNCDLWTERVYESEESRERKEYERLKAKFEK